LTSSEPDLAVLTDDGTGVSRVVVEVDGIPMSALIREVPQPRAVIVALHGGAVTSRYFHYPDRPRQSLLWAGAALGYTVIALDRPGYGESAGHAEQMNPPQRRVDLAYAAVDRLLASRPRGAGVFLLAHSIGCELAVRMACDERGTGLLGVELAGSGRQHHDGALETMSQWRRDSSGPRRTGGSLRVLLWEPTWLYPADVVGGYRILSPGPAYEGVLARTWAPEFPQHAARVRIPVHFTLGDHEKVWRSGPEALADLATLFTGSPRVVVEEQRDGGHNLSLGLSALAYHLKILSFVEECLLARGRAI
jgi:pimeloyl-ACP methyl ester carboxylesterase